MNAASTPATHRVLLYGDVDLSIIDGSAIWLISAATALQMAGADVTVQLKSRPTRETLVGHLRTLTGVTVVELAAGVKGPLSAADAVAALVSLDRDHPFDVVIARGFALCHALATDGTLAHKLWSYVTDIPRFSDPDYPRRAQGLQDVASASRVMLAQTEEARSFVEIVAPAASGKTLLIPPMLPDSLFELSREDDSGTVNLVYAGKLAFEWNPLEILELPSRLAEVGVDSHLTVFGDTIPASRPGWKERVLASLDEAKSNPRITLRGGQPRETVLADLANQSIGITWRLSDLDSSLEISTKLLEYCAAGVAPVLNRTAAHETLLGPDYPLFVDDDAVAAISRVHRSPGGFGAVGVRARGCVLDYSMSAAAQRFAGYLRRYAPAQPRVAQAVAVREAPLRVVLAGHDFKFAADIVTAMEGDPDLEFRIDRWETLRKHDERVSGGLSEWADVVICEWTGPNAIWYSRRKRPSQRLITRLHGFEARSTFLANLDATLVDKMVFVSGFYRDQVVEQMGWNPAFTEVVPNMVDADDFDRPKIPDARFHVGITGIVPALKRLDRVVDLAELLLAADDRFVFHVKGRMPWHYPYEWSGRSVQRDAYLRVFDRLRTSPVGERFVFDAFDPAMATWFRRIGFILSPSTFETFHLAPLEGMASGAIPVIWARPGARQIFGDRWVVDDTASAASRILGFAADPESYDAASADARGRARQYDLEPALARWRRLVHEVAKR